MSRCPIAAAGAAASSCPRSRSACGRTSATTPARRPAGDPAPGVRPRRDALRPRQQLRAALRLGRDQLRPDPARGPAPVPRRADHLHQGGLRHVAGPLRRPRLAQVPAGQPGPVAARGWAWSTSTSSTRTASTRTRRSKRRWARCDTAVQSGKALYAGISSYSPERTADAVDAILRSMGTPLLIHQPSYSMLNRWIEGGLLDVLGARGRGLHRLLAAGSGRADRQVPGRRAGGLAGGAGRLAVAATCSPSGPWCTCARWPRSPRPGARRWPSWRCPGRCATRG